MNKSTNFQSLSGINYGALSLAILVFMQSTAFGAFQRNLPPVVLPNAVYTWSDPVEETPATVAELPKVKEVVAKPAIPGGPDQPEVQSFSPIGTSDMVDPFTGDFSYNLPLMDVDGYPINMSYTAGVTMDQEASWVGLGWNLNPGVMNRSMRGIPDDFNGTEKIEKYMNLKRNWTLGTSAGLDIELFGFGPNLSGGGQAGGVGLNASLGITYNNYTGFNSTVSFGPSLTYTMGKNEDSELSAGLGFSGSSQGGATVSPSVGFSTKKKNERETVTKGINIGSAFNSRGGVSDVSISYKRTTSKTVTATKMVKDANGDPVKKTMDYTKSSSLPISSSFNFGMGTYTPQITMPMNSGGGTFSFKLGSDVVGFDGSLQFSGSYHAQWLKSNHELQPAFGYMNLDKGQNNKEAMMDFNRENDGSFTKNTPALPVPALTYDIFSASGHGIGGSYRIHRTDVGYVFDPKVANNSVNGSLGLEVDGGATFKGGIDLSATYSNSKSESWNTVTNQASKKMKYKAGKLTFREANEKAVSADPGHFAKIGGAEPVRFKVTSFTSIANTLVNSAGQSLPTQSSYDRQGEDKRNQVVYTLTNGELKQGLGIEPLHPDAFANTTNDYDHHIGQFTALNVEGSRYIYGIAAYSQTQKNISFAAGVGGSNSDNLDEDCNTGLVTYTATDRSLGNTHGVDNFYNEVITPPYAHSYLLTNVLNADYVDADAIKGPSKGDLGGYLKFSYNKINNYEWKNPVNENKATFDEGLNADATDDKAHFIYGKKELWYVKEIQSKNHIAIFYTSNRNDGRGVDDLDGGVTSSPAYMQKLDSIALFSLPDYEANGSSALPLKVVHFEYDYSLCPGYDQNIVAGAGKLTLNRVYFTYQNSYKGKYTPYEFEYGNNLANNPPYDMKSIDRWGGYKPKVNCGGNFDIASDPLRPSDFPYIGYDKASSDLWAGAWNMSAINLPSGGRIEVTYESDDYAYVQHKRANQMMKIIGVEKVGGGIETSGTKTISYDKNGNSMKNAKIYFELVPGYTSNINDYVSVGQTIYFRTLMDINGKYDFVPGYAKVKNTGIDNNMNGSGVAAGWVEFEPTTMMDNGSADYNPIAVTAIQFARIYLSKFIPPSSTNAVDENSNLPGLIESIGGAFSSLQELFIGPNLPLFNNEVGTKLVIDHSWLRVQNPNLAKLGGGHRVAQITMWDEWDKMTQNQMTKFSYGQVYNYKLENNLHSSGVAAYEPQMGGDENPWRQPIANNTTLLLAPDTRNYQETPFGEQFFPSPSVGYSRVTVTDLPRAGVTRTATGRVVNEFYTAKDFPTIVKRTPVDYTRFKLPIFAVFFSAMIDEMTASQGFVVETNDMHGKQKSTKVYAQGQNDPISKVEYFYRSEPKTFDGVSAKHLTNDVSTINKNGTVGTSTIGLYYEGVADFRKSTSNSISGTIGLNLNYTVPFILVPSVSGSGSFERTAFRSATFTKVIERFGIMEKTVASDLGSVVETADLAYDAETGTTLLTQTTTDFNDKVYNFTYPAHWYYDGMGQAYQNIGNQVNGPLSFVNGGSAGANSSQFAKGDEVTFLLNGVRTLGWVTDAAANSVTVLLKDGTPVAGTVTLMKVLRSGHRNLQTTPIGTLALRSNPLDHLTGNIFDKVLQAGAVEFNDEWHTFCECFLDDASESYTTNPYVLGTAGTWRPQASYLHLAGRTQTFENLNSNIREDGVFTSFTPFYKLNTGIWNIDRQNWTYTSSVTEFSPFGQTLETVDALKRFSSSMFGYNQTLPIAVASNTRYRQLGFDGFEDYAYDNCSDNHFKVGDAPNANVVEGESHTGKFSVKVSSNAPLIFSNTLTDDCAGPITCPQEQYDIYVDCVNRYNNWGKGQTEYLVHNLYSFQEFSAQNLCNCLEQLCNNLNGIMNGTIRIVNQNHFNNLSDLAAACDVVPPCTESDYQSYKDCVTKFNNWGKNQEVQVAISLYSLPDFINQNLCACLEKYCATLQGIINGTIPYTGGSQLDLAKACDEQAICTEADYNAYKNCIAKFNGWAVSAGSDLHLSVIYSLEQFVKQGLCECVDEFCKNLEGIMNGTIKITSQEQFAALTDLTKACDGPTGCTDADYNNYRECVAKFNNWAKATGAPFHIALISVEQFVQQGLCECLDAYCKILEGIINGSIKITSQEQFTALTDLTKACDGPTGCTDADYNNYRECVAKFNNWAKATGAPFYIALISVEQFVQQGLCECLDAYCKVLEGIINGSIKITSQEQFTALTDLTKACDGPTGCTDADYNNYRNCVSKFNGWAKSTGYPFHITTGYTFEEFVALGLCECLDAYCKVLEGIMNGTIKITSQEQFAALTDLTKACDGPTGCTDSDYNTYKNCVDKFNNWGKQLEVPITIKYYTFAEFASHNLCECLDKFCANLEGIINGTIKITSQEQFAALTDLAKACDEPTGCTDLDYKNYRNCVDKFSNWVKNNGFPFKISTVYTQADFVSQNLCECLDKFCANLEGIMNGTIKITSEAQFAALTDLTKACNEPTGCTDVEYNNYKNCITKFNNWAKNSGATKIITTFYSFEDFVKLGLCECVDKFCANLEGIMNGTIKVTGQLQFVALTDLAKVCNTQTDCTEAEYTNYKNCIEKFNLWAKTTGATKIITTVYSFDDFVKLGLCECVDKFCANLEGIMNGSIKVTGQAQLVALTDLAKVCAQQAACTDTEYNNYKSCVEKFNLWAKKTGATKMITTVYPFEKFVTQELCKCVNAYCKILEDIMNGTIKITSQEQFLSLTDLSNACKTVTDPCPPLTITYIPGSKGIPGGVQIGPYTGNYTITYVQLNATNPYPSAYIQISTDGKTLTKWQCENNVVPQEPWCTSRIHVTVTFDNGCVLETDI